MKGKWSNPGTGAVPSSIPPIGKEASGLSSTTVSELTLYTSQEILNVEVILWVWGREYKWLEELEQKLVCGVVGSYFNGGLCHPTFPPWQLAHIYNILLRESKFHSYTFHFETNTYTDLYIVFF